MQYIYQNLQFLCLDIINRESLWKLEERIGQGSFIIVFVITTVSLGDTPNSSYPKVGYSSISINISLEYDLIDDWFDQQMYVKIFFSFKNKNGVYIST